MQKKYIDEKLIMVYVINIRRAKQAKQNKRGDMMKLYEDVKTKTHDEFEDMCDYDKGEPCLICGKPVKPTANMKMLRPVCAGQFITDNEGDFDDDMGWYPVGNTCYKKFMIGA